MSGEAVKAKVAETPAYAVLADNLANAKQRRPTVADYAGLSTAYGKAVSAILQGQAEVGPALDAAKATADRALADQ